FPWDFGSNPGQPANAHQEVPDSGSSSSTPSVAPAEGNVPVLIASSIPDDPHLAPLGVSTGPLPARSAAPLGGVLAVGDPVPLINRRDAAAIDLELIGLSPREPDAPAVALADTAEEDATGPQGRLTPVLGPGGFPLLASAPTRSLAAAPAALPWASAPQGSAATPVADLSVPARAASSSRPHSRSRSSVGSGLTFALTLVFGLMLPDLAVAFQLAEPPRTRFRLGGRDDMV
ncbi:MAG TPA: hypothetical protein VKP69_31810, partial [Isosphaeraceae bacterium]|nr:hypothetical protein [Isosphaeraceae bacterium]